VTARPARIARHRPQPVCLEAGQTRQASTAKGRKGKERDKETHDITQNEV